MNSRLIYVFLVAAGLGLFLALAVTAAPQVGREQAAARTFSADLAPYDPARVRVSPQITFTPVATVYLPLVANSYCPPLYTDDFSDPGSGWPVFDDGTTRHAYYDDQYLISIVYSSDWSVATPGFAASDFALSVDVVNMAQMDNGDYGLVFGLSDDESQFYAFKVSTSGYRLDRYDAGVPTTLAWDFGSVNPPTEVNRLRVERSGSAISAYVNDYLVATVTDGTYTGSRKVGVIADPGQGLWVLFDNFVVESLTCGASAAGFE
ncbi:MAG: hypothetical protein JXA89_21680 [Anaerolineae bacterium]|nr:hypothetical protein [Anaerolineae bacterium]